jgi:hypothetical protein
MGKDNTPSVRQAAQLQRKKANRITLETAVALAKIPANPALAGLSAFLAHSPNG